MEDTAVVVTSIICGTFLLTVVLLILWRMRSQKQMTLQKLLEHEQIDQEKLMQILMPQHRFGQDFRRGILLLGLGLTLGVFFFFMGGSAWMLASVPVAVGLIYLFFWWLNDAKK